ncbi:hypothetical protein ACJJIF_12460 [Microbulbifer sp. SSSA002]|uniref:hypothetical protein n=1 Tax=Microbulbifer sp. SSSA002 TaxID=3243376 RepID=UPI00403A1994
MLRILILVCFLLASGCSDDTSKNTVVLNYNDFGPQVIASEIIGMEWWQWQDHGESRPRDYDIKVVVYRKVALDEIKKIYSINPDQEQDYRYLKYEAAIIFLDKKIEDNVIDEVTIRLQKTRDFLTDKLGDKN